MLEPSCICHAWLQSIASGMEIGSLLEDWTLEFAMSDKAGSSKMSGVPSGSSSAATHGVLPPRKWILVKGAFRGGTREMSSHALCKSQPSGPQRLGS